MTQKTDLLYKALIDSMFECKDSLTKEELKKKIEEKGIEVKDIDYLMEFLSEQHLIIPKANGTYQVSVEHAFDKIHQKQSLLFD